MPQNRKDIAVIGAGRWGTLLAQLAADAGHQVHLHCEDAATARTIRKTRKNPCLPELDELHSRVAPTTGLAMVRDHCHLVLIAVAASRLREIGTALGERLDGAHCVVHALRGLEPDTVKVPSTVLREVTAARKVGAFIGPALVAELLSGHPNAVVVASRFPEVISAVQDVFAGPALRVYGNRDLRGAEVSAAAATMMAVAVGICLELQLGPAAMALLVSRSTAEMGRLVQAAGGDPTTAFGLAGLGDLIVAREANSRDVEAGRMVARGAEVEHIHSELGGVDGFRAAPIFASLAQQHGVEAHFTDAVNAISRGELDGPSAMRLLMTGVGHLSE